MVFKVVPQILGRLVVSALVGVASLCTLSPEVMTNLTSVRDWGRAIATYVCPMDDRFDDADWLTGYVQVLGHYDGACCCCQLSEGGSHGVSWVVRDSKWRSENYYEWNWHEIMMAVYPLGRMTTSEGRGI